MRRAQSPRRIRGGARAMAVTRMILARRPSDAAIAATGDARGGASDRGGRRTAFFRARRARGQRHLRQRTNGAIAASFHSTPEPVTPAVSAMPPVSASGSRSASFHQSTYSSQWAFGVTARSCALTSGHR